MAFLEISDLRKSFGEGARLIKYKSIDKNQI